MALRLSRRRLWLRALKVISWLPDMPAAQDDPSTFLALNEDSLIMKFVSTAETFSLSDADDKARIAHALNGRDYDHTVVLMHFSKFPKISSTCDEVDVELIPKGRTPAYSQKFWQRASGIEERLTCTGHRPLWRKMREMLWRQLNCFQRITAKRKLDIESKNVPRAAGKLDSEV